MYRCTNFGVKGVRALDAGGPAAARRCVMQGPERDFDDTTDSDARNALRPKAPEERTDRFGTRASLLALFVAFLIAAIWFVGRPSFEKCSAIETVTDRNACYDELRQELLKPPAK